MLRRRSPAVAHRPASLGRHESSGRHAARGSVRPLGLFAATLTAAAVFGLGVLILPSIEPELPPPPPPPAPEPPPPPPPPPPPVIVDAAAADTEPVVAAETKASQAPRTKPTRAEPAAPVAKAKPTAATPDAPPPPKAETKATAKAEPKPEPKPEAKPEPKPEAKPEPKAEAKAEAKAQAKTEAKPDSATKSADKEAAREAWRKNTPDVSAEPGKAAMLIPIKGSTEGTTHHVTTKPRSVLITLPKGEAMITMPFYNIKRDGFRQLSIKKDAEGATTLRIVLLPEAGDPQVEIKDDFVRLTVKRPGEAGAPAKEATKEVVPAESVAPLVGDTPTNVPAPTTKPVEKAPAPATKPAEKAPAPATKPPEKAPAPAAPTKPPAPAPGRD